MIGETFRHLRDQILRLLKEKVNTTKDIGLINKMLFFSEQHKLSWFDKRKKCCDYKSWIFFSLNYLFYFFFPQKYNPCSNYKDLVTLILKQCWPAGGMWTLYKHMGLIRETLLLDKVQLIHNGDLQNWWSLAIWQGHITARRWGCKMYQVSDAGQQMIQDRRNSETRLAGQALSYQKIQMENGVK